MRQKSESLPFAVGVCSRNLCEAFRKVGENSKEQSQPTFLYCNFAILVNTGRLTTRSRPNILTPPNDFGLSQSHRRQAFLVYRQVQRGRSSSPAVIALASGHPVSENYTLRCD